jgi:hypothetical protein
MAIKKGAILPKDIESLIGRQVYFKKESPYTRESRRLKPLKLYTIDSISNHSFNEEDSHLIVWIIDDTGDRLAIVLGSLTCAFLSFKYYWSLKQLPAAIKDKSNGS